MINKYELNARIYPVLISLLPILILCIYFSVDYKNIYSAIGGIGLITLLSYIFGQLGRDRGKRIEKKLWNEWGGTPTTQILRFSDGIIDAHTTQKLHEILNQKTNIGLANMKPLENLDKVEADKIYEAWCNFLRRQTRDTNKYKLLFKENVNYGFRRNLLGLKPIGISIIIVALIIIGVHSYSCNQFLELFNNYLLLISLMSLLILLLFWVFVVTKKWVKIIAFTYAERLIETVDQ